MKAPLPAPADWPSQADEDYDRIAVLGAGAFGEVWLAKSKRPDENDQPVYVAIKGVSIRNEQEGATAAREMAILSQLNHPNIIKLLHGYEPASPTATGRYMALSYVKGPDLGELLEARGALGLPLAQLIARDLISAVAYCHVRGVMHRDIKPDNIMLEGCMEGKAWVHDAAMWGDGKLPQGRFKAVLADFGFARATSKEDYEQKTEEEIQQSKRAMFDRKKSRIMFKRMSAVGTKHFAAPEIETNVRAKTDSEIALAPCVSSYALISDAYAVGATLSELTTGVPPGQDPETYVDLNRRTMPEKSHSFSKIPSPVKVLKRKLHRRFSFGNHHYDHTDQKHDIQLRHMHELPFLARDLITSMLMKDANLRMSTREAQNHEWIGGYDRLPHGDFPSRPEDPIVYIKNELDA